MGGRPLSIISKGEGLRLARGDVFEPFIVASDDGSMSAAGASELENGEEVVGCCTWSAVGCVAELDAAVAGLWRDEKARRRLTRGARVEQREAAAQRWSEESTDRRWCLGVWQRAGQREMLVVGSDASLPAPLRNEETSTVCIQQGPSASCDVVRPRRGLASEDGGGQRARRGRRGLE